MPIGIRIMSFRVLVSGLYQRLKRQRPKHNQGFDGTAPVAEISLNLKIDMHRVGLNLCKNGFGAAYRARVSWLEHERRILKAHVLFLRTALGWCGLGRLPNVLSKVELKARALCYGVMGMPRPHYPNCDQFAAPQQTARWAICGHIRQLGETRSWQCSPGKRAQTASK